MDSNPCSEGGRRPSAAISSTEGRLTHAGEPRRVLRWRLVRPARAEPRSLPFALLVHGFGGSYQLDFYPPLAAHLARSGMAALCFNLSGSGIGEDLETFTELEALAHNTYTRELEDVARLHAEVRAGRWPELDPDRGGLFGHSRGGGIALLHAAEDRDCRAVVTWAPMDAILKFSPERRALWRAQGHIDVRNPRGDGWLRLGPDLLLDAERHRERLDIPAACARLRCPALLVHGDRDAILPQETSRGLLQALPAGRARLCILPGAGHAFGARHPVREVSPVLARALDETSAFLAGHLGAEPPDP